MTTNIEHKDARIERAHEFLQMAKIASTPMELEAIALIEGLLAYADERLRVNVGLVMQNQELTRRLREPVISPTPLQDAEDATT